jgi:ribonucleotide monophosphatase NagD (HAD superfamily)
LEDRTYSGIIKEIQWYNNTPYVIYTNGSRFSPLNTWKKLKDPLFTKAQKEEIIEIIKEEYKC